MSCHSLCVSHRGTNPTGRWWFQPPIEHFQHVRSTSYLLKAFGILYVLIQSGHKYCVLFGCVCVCSISAQTFETGVFMFELSWSMALWLLVPIADDDADGVQLIMEPRSERRCTRFGRGRKRTNTKLIRYSTIEDDAVWDQSTMELRSELVLYP